MTRLLAGHERSAGVLDRPILLSFPDPMLGRTLGRYRLLRLIGRGGMGSVYLAERADESYRQQVAVKVIRRTWPGDTAQAAQLVERFHRERQILAALVHPGICRLLDGGTSDDGWPYLVMEYLEGEPIDHDCRRRDLDLRRRLELLRRVAEAVHFAHQHLVIHRDLKPANVLVTAEGQPKLVDFGTAKLLAGKFLEGSGLDPGETGPGLRLLTPRYASPEQLRGEAVTTATDVFGLGTVLFQVLCDQAPFEEAHALRAAGEREPPRFPDTLLAGLSRHDRALAADAEAIVRKALRPEPARRYASAAELAADLGRLLEGRPVAARGGSWRYQAGKLVRRHRAAVASALLVVLSLAGGVLATARQAHVARHERDQTRAAMQFLVDLFEISDPNENLGRKLTAVELLERGEAALATLDAPAEARAELLDLLGTAYAKLRLRERAAPLLAAALERDVSAEPLETAARQARLGRLHLSLGEVAAAAPLLEAAFARRRDRLGEDHPETAASLDDLAWLRREQGDLDAAERLARQALELRRGRPAPGESLAASLDRLAIVLGDQGRLDEATELHRQALARRRQLFGDHHTQVITSLNNLAAVRYQAGDLAEAEQLLRRALDLDRQLFAHDHPERARALANLADVLRRQGQLAAARGLYQQALAIQQSQLGPDHADLAASHVGLAFTDLAAGQESAAEGHFRRAAEILRRHLGPRHAKTLTVQRELALLLYRRQDDAAAEGELRRLLEGQLETFKDPDTVASTRLYLGTVLTRLGRPGEAEPLLRQAVEVRRRVADGGEGALRLAAAQGRLGECLLALGRPAEAEPFVRASLATRRAAAGD